MACPDDALSARFASSEIANCLLGESVANQVADCARKVDPGPCTILPRPLTELGSFHWPGVYTKDTTFPKHQQAFASTTTQIPSLFDPAGNGSERVVAQRAGAGSARRSWSESCREAENGSACAVVQCAGALAAVPSR